MIASVRHHLALAHNGALGELSEQSADETSRNTGKTPAAGLVAPECAMIASLRWRSRPAVAIPLAFGLTRPPQPTAAGGCCQTQLS
jgi:hypothetical protein